MIKIRWHGHACFEISDGKTIVIDPHDGSSIGIAPPRARADIILITHDHFDHNQARVVEKEGSIVVREGDRKIDGIEIKAFKAYHDESRGMKRGEISIFKVSIDGIKFCHLGDIGHVLDDETVDKIGEIDILFVPVGGTFTVDAKSAFEICQKLKTRVIVPMHYKIEGLSLPIERVDRFLEIAKDYAIRHVANEIEIEKEDLPESREIWIFSL